MIETKRTLAHDRLKSIFKELRPAYVVGFVFCYMLFIFEPLLMYSTNKYEFRFSLAKMLTPMTVIFFIFLAGALAIITGVFFLCRRFFKDKRLFGILVIEFFFVFVIFYIEGNFFSGYLPVLDGKEYNIYIYI